MRAVFCLLLALMVACGNMTPSGDITSVNTPAGGGLSGGVSFGAANLSIAPCTNPGDVRAWDGDSWECTTTADTLGPDGDKGDITVGGTGTTLTIDNGAVTLAKITNIATATILGRVAAGNGSPQALTGTQATSLLDTFTSTLKGLVPSPGTATGTKYLADNGSWQTPPNNGITGTITSGDLIVATGAGTVGNFAGSSPGACAAGNAVTRAVSAATGQITLTCAPFGSSSLTNTATANSLAKSNGTNLVTSDYIDGASGDTIADSLRVSVDDSYLGADTTSVPTLGFTKKATFSPKLTYGSGTSFAISQSSGATIAATNTFTDRLTIDTSGNVAITSGTLDMAAHKITGLSNGTASSDAAAFGQIANNINAAVDGTSGKVPVYTAAHALGNSSINDDLAGNVFSASKIWGGWSTVNGTALAGGAGITSTTSTDIGFDLGMDSGTGNVVWRSKLATGGVLAGYVGAGTSPGNTNQWLSVDGSGNVTHAHNLTIGGALDLNSHQIHNVTDPSSAQDAATKNYVDTATANDVVSTLTSGTVPIATAAHTLGDSTLLYDGSVWTTTQGFGTSGILFAGTNTNRAVYIGAGGVASINARYNTNSEQTLFLNHRGYNGSTTQFRNLQIDDGKGNAAVDVTGSTLGTEFHGAVTADSTLTADNGNISLAGTSGTVNVGTGGGAVQIGALTTGTTTLASPTLQFGSGGATTANHWLDRDGASRPVASSCGTTPSVVGNDRSGIITVGTGGAASCTVTWHTAYGSNYGCTLSSRSGGSFTSIAYTTTKILITKALNAGEKIDYQCADH